MRLWPSTSENSQMIRSDARLVGEDRAEMREVDLRLAAGRRLEADLERRRLDRPDLAQQVGENGVAAGVAEVAQFAMQPTPGQLRKRRQPLAQIARERRELARPRRTRAVSRRLQASLDVLAHRLAVEPHPARDRRDADALAVQFKDHDDLPKSDQRRIPQRERGHHRSSAPTACQAPTLRPSAHLGNFQPAQLGIIRPALQYSVWHWVGSGIVRRRCW